MRASLLMTVLCTIAVAACDGSGDGTSTGGTQTIKLDANADGTLGYCDASGTCQSLPNPDNCATLDRHRRHCERPNTCQSVHCSGR